MKFHIRYRTASPVETDLISIEFRDEKRDRLSGLETTSKKEEHNKDVPRHKYSLAYFS
jgi:hypothetical protein